MFSIAVLRNWGENVTSDDDSLGVGTGVAFLGPAPVSSFVKNLHAVLIVAAPVPTLPGIAGVCPPCQSASRACPCEGTAHWSALPFLCDERC